MLRCTSATVSVFLVIALNSAAGPTAQAQDDWNPAGGSGLVVAQGVAALPAGDVAWRTARGRALPVAEATFERRALGFVVASGGPLLLIDGERGDVLRLGQGEAAFVLDGALQLRASATDRPVGYLVVELTAADAPSPAGGETVLQPGQPFAAPPGMRDLDLIAANLLSGETLDVPDAGSRNVLLVLDGAATAGPTGGAGATLLAGEAAGFVGPLVVGVAGDGGGASVVVAAIGPEVVGVPDLPIVDSLASPVPTTTPGDSDPQEAAVAGSIAVQVFGCPAGMTPETVMPGACVPVADLAEVVLSGGGLPAPLTLADAAPVPDGFTWDGLPAGEYTLALAVLPPGYAAWALAASGAEGDPIAGYRITVSAETPDIAARIYAFPEE
jgi:hypothetical protein